MRKLKQSEEKISNVIKITIGGLLVLTTFSLTKDYMENKNKDIVPYKIEYLENTTKDDLEFLKKEDIINDIREVINLETLQVNASTEFNVTLGKDYLNKIFQKEKSVKFYGIGKYYIDLSNISYNDVIIDNVNKEITIFLNEDNYHIESYILEDETEFKDVHNGILAWYKFEIPMEDSYILENKANESLMKKFNEKEFMEIFRSSSEKNLNNLFSKFTNQNYKINIKFN